MFPKLPVRAIAERVRRGPLPRYGLAVLCGTAALVLSLQVPDIVSKPFFLLFVAAAGVSTFFGGWGPGVLATFLGGLAIAYYLLPPLHSLDVGVPHDQLRLGLYEISTLLLVWLISELRTAQQTVRRGDERFRRAQQEAQRWFATTLNSIGEAVLATDAAGRIRFMNPPAQQLTGWELAEASGRLLGEVLRVHHEQRDERVEDLAAKVIRTGGALGVANHAAVVARDGRRVPVDQSGFPIRDEDGRLVGVVLVIRDISGRRRTEEALRSSEKLAATGRLAASIAHEINNPLEGLINLLYVIEHDRTLGEKSRHHVELAEQEVERIMQIVQQTLGFYREAREPTPVRLAEFLDNVLQLYSRKLKPAKVTVERRYEFVGAVYAFPGEIRQVLGNIVVNAIEAMMARGRGGKLVVHTFAASDWGTPRRKGVHVVIGDSGPGISREVRRRLFEPFFTTKGEKGTGLGLWVSHGIVQKHGGRLRVYSSTRPGRSGTIFDIFLPEVASAPTPLPSEAGQAA